MSEASFKGTDDQQALAAEIFRLMTTQGSLFALNAPIKQSLDNLADFLASQRTLDRDRMVAEIDAALQANEEVFFREERDEGIVYTTSRQGRYVPYQEDTSHTFKQRLYEPENPLPVDDISVVVSTSRPALTSVEPVFISDYWQIQAGLTPVSLQPGEAPAPVIAAELQTTGEPAEFRVTPEEPLTFEEEPAAAVLADAEVEEEFVEAEEAPREAEEALVEAEEEPVALAANEAEPIAPVVLRNAVTLGDGLMIDLSQSVESLIANHGDALAGALKARIDQDPLRRIVSFGRSFYPEASVISLGKNDMRRIRDYILEVGEPLLDTSIIADLYYHNPRQGDYEGFRFSLNYRLSREKDFEFVGVEGARLWSTKGLPAIGTKRVKAGEMAHLTTYLVEGYDDSLEMQSAASIRQSGTVTRLLSFFEWEYGILPFDASIATLLPPPMLPEQRSAVLRFESPQHYTNYLVEVRYPTGNRGGWLQGLEEFFQEHLVAGALITISRTDEPNVFTITYEDAPAAEDRLLTLDDKKNKFAFANISYYCMADADNLVTQQRFGRLKNLKSLPMTERRKSDAVLAHVFETVGDPVGTRDEPRYRVSLGDLLIAYNVLRPASRPYLSMLLAADEAFDSDPARTGYYFFKPAPRAADKDSNGDDDDDEDTEQVVLRRGRYDDE